MNTQTDTLTKTQSNALTHTQSNAQTDTLTKTQTNTQSNALTYTQSNALTYTQSKTKIEAQNNSQTVERPRGRILQRLRVRIMQGQPLCKMCDDKGLVTPGAEMDHIVPLFMGGSNDDDNLQMLCVECHRKKSADDLGVRFRPTIGSDGWPISPTERQPGGAGQNPSEKTP